MLKGNRKKSLRLLSKGLVKYFNNDQTSEFTNVVLGRKILRGIGSSHSGLIRFTRLIPPIAFLTYQIAQRLKNKQK